MLTAARLTPPGTIAKLPSGHDLPSILSDCAVTLHLLGGSTAASDDKGCRGKIEWADRLLEHRSGSGPSPGIGMIGNAPWGQVRRSITRRGAG